MLKIIHGDIFESKMQTITNPVNCVGVMGKGLALEFKKRYPQHYAEYCTMCAMHILKPGLPKVTDADGRSILLFPTKDHWRNLAKLEYIDEALSYIARNYTEMGITSLALPKIGAGLGGLPWAQVRTLIVKHFGSLPINIEIYE